MSTSFYCHTPNIAKSTKSTIRVRLYIDKKSICLRVILKLQNLETRVLSLGYTFDSKKVQ